MTQNLGTPLPVGTSITPNTLRALLEQLRGQSTSLSLTQTVGIIVPLCVELAERHAAGEHIYVTPSSLMRANTGRYHLHPDLAQRAPTLPRDRACLAPEERSGDPGNARASVYAVGAMLYECLTGEIVGPGMRRPTDLVPSIPAVVEAILGKALVADPSHRPDDLRALAQAIHHLAPTASDPPPPADESHLDGDAGFTVDVSMSMLPPPPKSPQAAVMGLSPYDMIVREQPKAVNRDERVTELSAVKNQLESDPRPRYVVVKDGMDHGPFTAVEILQQIATHNFVDSDVLRDSLSKDERPIKDWEQFAPFAEQSKLHRDIKAEKAAIERVVVAEQRSTRGKAFFGIIALGVVLAGGAIWFLTHRGSRNDEVAVHGETATNVETDGSLKSRKKSGMGRNGVVGAQGGYPVLGSGLSCESAQAAYIEEMKIGSKGQADITQGQYASFMNNGSYLGGCGVPEAMSVSICAAVQNGRAVGVSVSTRPANARVAGCVSGAVRSLRFPSHPKLDVVRTSF